MTRLRFLDVDKDVVLRLGGRYFERCEVLLQDFHKLSKEHQRRGRLSDAKTSAYRTYFFLWLSTLWVVAEGLLDSRVQRSIAKLAEQNLDLQRDFKALMERIEEHKSELKLFRNEVFHFSPEVKRRDEFLDAESIHGNTTNWAFRLHDELKGYFRKYNFEALAKDLVVRKK